jgi:hypothetical protein
MDDFTSMLETCAVIGASAAQTASRIVSWLKVEWLKEYARIEADTAHPWIRDFEVTAFMSAAMSVCESVGFMWAHSLIELASELPMQVLEDSLVEFCCHETVAANAPRLHQTLYARFLNTANIPESCWRFYSSIVSCAVCKKHLFGYVQQIAGKLAGLPCLLQVLSTISSALRRCSESRKSIPEPNALGTNDVTLFEEGKEHELGLENVSAVSVGFPCFSEQVASFFVETILCIPDILKVLPSQRRPVITDIECLSQCVVACRNPPMIKKFIDIILNTSTTSVKLGLRELKSLLYTALVSSQHDEGLVTCILDVLHLNPHMTNIGTDNLLKLPRELHSIHYGTKSSKEYDYNFATFAVRYTASILCGPKLTHKQILTLIRTLCTVKHAKPGVMSLAHDLSNIACESFQDDIERDSSINVSSDTVKETVSVLVGLCSMFEQLNFSTTDACLEPWICLGSKEICIMLFSLDEEYLSNSSIYYSTEWWHVHPTNWSRGSLLKQATKLLIKLMSSLDTQKVDAIPASDLPRLAKLVIFQKVLGHNTEPVLAQVERILQHGTAEEKEKAFEVLFDTPSVRKLQNADCLELRRLAKYYIEFLNQQPSAKPPPPRTDFSFPSAEYSECSDEIEDFLRSPHATLVIKCNSVPEARSKLTHLGIDYRVSYDIRGRGKTTELIFTKRLGILDEEAYLAHKVNRETVHKLEEAFPGIMQEDCPVVQPRAMASTQHQSITHTHVQTAAPTQPQHCTIAPSNHGSTTHFLPFQVHPGQTPEATDAALSSNHAVPMVSTNHAVPMEAPELMIPYPNSSFTPHFLQMPHPAAYMHFQPNFGTWAPYPFHSPFAMQSAHAHQASITPFSASCQTGPTILSPAEQQAQMQASMAFSQPSLHMLNVTPPQAQTAHVQMHLAAASPSTQHTSIGITLGAQMARTHVPIGAVGASAVTSEVMPMASPSLSQAAHTQGPMRAVGASAVTSDVMPTAFPSLSQTSEMKNHGMRNFLQLQAQAAPPSYYPVPPFMNTNTWSHSGAPQQIRAEEADLRFPANMFGSSWPSLFGIGMLQGNISGSSVNSSSEDRHSNGMSTDMATAATTGAQSFAEKLDSTATTLGSTATTLGSTATTLDITATSTSGKRAASLVEEDAPATVKKYKQEIM